MSAGAQARAAAARAVAAVVTQGRSFDHAFADQQRATSQADASLARLLAYESLRWYLRLEPLLKRLASRPDALTPEIRALAIVGFAQIFHIDVPAYAAVSATVDATRLLNQPKASGLVNALLRRAQREGVSIFRDIDRDSARQTAHPAWLVARLKRDYPEQWSHILEANNARAPFWLRVNRRRTTRQAYCERLVAADIPHEISAIAADAIRLTDAVDVNTLPGFNDGDVSIQDAAAQLAVAFMEARGSERVLDACAAPGGKTCHLLERAPAVQVVAVDIAPERIERVRQNLERLQLQATLVTADVGAPAEWWDGAQFNRILLDVPCSATGVIRRHPDIKLLRRESDIADLAKRQTQLLDALWPLLKPGGRLVYASCSALRAENSDVVTQFVARTPDARDNTVSRVQALGLQEATGVGHAIIAGTAGMDGFYYACLDKT